MGKKPPSFLVRFLVQRLSLCIYFLFSSIVVMLLDHKNNHVDHVIAHSPYFTSDLFSCIFYSCLEPQRFESLYIKASAV